MQRLALTGVTLALLVASHASAEPNLTAGKNIIALQVSGGSGYFASGDGGPWIYLSSAHELGVNVQAWHLFSNNWATAFGAGIGFYETTQDADPNRWLPISRVTVKGTSWHANLGIERVVRLADEVHMLMGPGLQYWRGGEKIERNDSSATKVPDATRLAVYGRIGAHITVANHFGLLGQIGLWAGYTTARAWDAKATSWSSGQLGEMGISFHF